MQIRLIRAAPILVLALGALLASSCKRAEGVEARSAKAAEVPNVAVARVTTEDLSHGLVLTAEFKPFQEIDVSVLSVRARRAGLFRRDGLAIPSNADSAMASLVESSESARVPIGNEERPCSGPATG